VLLAEDHAPTAKLMSMTLRKLGCEVTVAENGVMAINAFQSMARLNGSAVLGEAPGLMGLNVFESQPFQLILMDGNMPFMGKASSRCLKIVLLVLMTMHWMNDRWLSGHSHAAPDGGYRSYFGADRQCSHGRSGTLHHSWCQCGSDEAFHQPDTAGCAD